jgi:hypothetical protein
MPPYATAARKYQEFGSIFQNRAAPLPSSFPIGIDVTPVTAAKWALAHKESILKRWPVRIIAV